MNDIILNTITIILTICIIIGTILYLILIDFIRWVKCKEHTLLATKAEMDQFKLLHQNPSYTSASMKGKCIKCCKKIEFYALSK
jgi:Trk-type K+ transport system membrane component